MNTATAHIPRSVLYAAPPPYPDIPGGIDRATCHPTPTNAPPAQGKDFS